MRQRGFIQLSVMAWAAIAAGVVIVALGIAVKVQTSRLDSVKAEYAQFKATTEAIGKAAELAKKKQEADDKERKGKADAENAKTKRDLAGLYDAYRSLRDQRSRSGFVPQAAPGSASPATASFDRGALDNALRGFDKGVAGLLREGDEAIVDLNSAKEWARR